MSNVTFHDSDWALWHLLRQAREAIPRMRAKELARYGITGAQGYRLLVISTIGGKATPPQIIRHGSQAPHSVAEGLDRMESYGLLKKVKDLEKKNLVRVVLTEKGRRVLSRYWSTNKSIRRIISCLSVEERRQLRACLKRLWAAGMREIGEDKVPLKTKDAYYNLWLLIVQLSDVMLRIINRQLAKLRLSVEYLSVLFVIHDLGGKATSAEIARQVRRTAPSISELLARMERDGLVIKVGNSGTGNMVWVVITQQGMAASEKLAEVASIHRIMSNLSDEERLQLRSCLEKLLLRASAEIR